MLHGGRAHGVTTPARQTHPSGGQRSSSKVHRAVATVFGAFVTLVVASTAPAFAESRTLDLYNAHTRERLTITFKKNGRYIPSALAELNHFLRDWRRNEQIKMDPRLFDTVWELYSKSGASQPIHVVCGYRALATNEMLRSRSGGVAKHSQHTQGKAMDMFIPGVSINRLREIGMKMQHGGVGWYPTSGSPFVHIDVGNVRAWPRMTRAQLVRLFPDGKTVHLPSDGKPLAGYQQALAELKRNGSVRSTAVASADDDTPRKGGGLLAMLFGGGEEDAEQEIQAASNKAPAKKKPVEAAKPAATTATVVRTKPADVPAEPAPAPVVVPPPVVVAAAVPKPTPAPERPEPQQPTSLAEATLPAETPKPEETPAPVAVAAAEPAPIPMAKPEIAIEVAALTPAPLPPRSRAELLPEPETTMALAAAPLPAAPSLVPLPPAEPANAQMALAEVAHDTTPLSGSASALGYASATAATNAAAPQRPALRVASLAPPPAATRGLTVGQADPLAALPGTTVGEGLKSDPLLAAAGAPAAADLPVYDGRQSAYWGVFAQMVHPDQRRMGTLLAEPATVIMSSFTSAPYGDLKATRFTGTSLPRLPLVRFTKSSDLAMR